MELENLLNKYMSSIRSQLNEKQNLANNYMLNGHNLFLTGAGGTGKTHTINTYKKLASKDLKIATTSTTGVSALLMNGVTLHSYLGIGLGKGSVDQLYVKISKNNYIRKKWKELNVLIIDEVSMLTPTLFDKLEHLARRIRKDERHFGGIQLILSGDFCQLNPVEDPDQFCFEAKSWDKCINKIVYLTDIIRQSDVEFQQFLNEIRLGIISDKTRQILNDKTKNTIVHSDITPTKLFALNNDVNKLNETKLNELATVGVEFFEYEMSFNFLKKCKDQDSMIQHFTKNCIAPQTLQLCIGAQVMLIANLDVSSGLVNGSRGIVVAFKNDFPIIKFLNGKEQSIEFYTWSSYDSEDNLILQADQIPLKIAFSCSIHKCQGVTLDYAEINLENVFAPGMAYVALSRIRDLKGLNISGKVDISSIVVHPKALDFYAKLN